MLDPDLGPCREDLLRGRLHQRARGNLRMDCRPASSHRTSRAVAGVRIAAGWPGRGAGQLYDKRVGGSPCDPGGASLPRARPIGETGHGPAGVIVCRILLPGSRSDRDATVHRPDRSGIVAIYQHHGARPTPHRRRDPEVVPNRTRRSRSDPGPIGSLGVIARASSACAGPPGPPPAAVVCIGLIRATSEGRN